MNSDHGNILVLGGTGLLGSELLLGKYFQDCRCIGQGLRSKADVEVNLEDMSQVKEMLAYTRPSAIINLVALTNVDLCENSPNEAYKVNVRTLQNVVQAAASLPHTPRLIHISTDQVYDGQGPHKEEDVSLSNYYAFSKYAAELVALSAGGIVLRTNFFGKSRSENRKSFTDWLYQELKAGRDIQVFEDVLFSPLSTHSLCEAIKSAVSSCVSGVFNLGAHDGMSKADFAFRFAECLGLPKGSMSRVKTNDVDFLKTYRPKDMRLDVGAFETAMRVSLPTLTSEIGRAAKEYRI